MIVSHLPTGPTACFKLSNFRNAAEIGGHGTQTGHVAEVILNRFTTRVGHRVGRFLGSMFPHVRACPRPPPPPHALLTRVGARCPRSRTLRAGRW